MASSTDVAAINRMRTIGRKLGQRSRPTQLAGASAGDPALARMRAIGRKLGQRRSS